MEMTHSCLRRGRVRHVCRPKMYASPRFIDNACPVVSLWAPAWDRLACSLTRYCSPVGRLPGRRPIVAYSTGSQPCPVGASASSGYSLAVGRFDKLHAGILFLSDLFPVAIFLISILSTTRWKRAPLALAAFASMAYRQLLTATGPAFVGSRVSRGRFERCVDASTVRRRRVRSRQW